MPVGKYSISWPDCSDVFFASVSRFEEGVAFMTVYIDRVVVRGVVGVRNVESAVYDIHIMLTSAMQAFQESFAFRIWVSIRIAKRSSAANMVPTEVVWTHFSKSRYWNM